MDKRWYTALPWLVAAAMAVLAAWLLGGPAALAYPLLGSMAWAAAALALLSVILQWWNYRPFAAYDAARGRADQHPLRRFAWGCLWAIPLWLFILILLGSMYNPAYIRDAAGELVLQEFNGALPLVIDPGRSRPGIWFLTGLLAMLSMLGNPVMRPRRRWIRWLLAAMLVNTMILTWAGFWYRFTGADALPGRHEPVASYFFATFYDKNHWAAWIILHCGIAGWFFFRDLPRWQADSRRAGAGGLALMALLFFSLSLTVVDSRSGILLFAVLAVAMGVALYRRLRSNRGRYILMGGFLIALAGFIYLSYLELQTNGLRARQQIDTVDSIVIDQIRSLHTPNVCLNMFKDRPVWGWGYLSYDPLFPVYATDYFRDAEGNLRTDMEFAHSDWLQHLAEFGAVGSLLLLLGMYPFLNPLLRSRILGSGLLLLGCMAVWECPFSNPAVLASSAALLAFARGMAFDDAT